MKSKNTIIMTVALVGIILVVAIRYLGLTNGSVTEVQDEQVEETPEIGHGEDEEIHLQPEQIEKLGIQVDGVKVGNVRAIINRPATITFDLDRVAKVGPRITAKVVRVNKDLGDLVDKGEKIAVMSSVQLGKAKARYLTVRARVETERASYEREKKLYAKRISSEADMLEAQARYREAEAKLEAAREALRLYGLSPEEIEAVQSSGGQSLSYYRLTSPIKGIIQRRDLAPGDTVEPDKTPIYVVDTQQMWVMVDAFERDVPLLTLGQEMELTVRSLPGHTFRGTVDWVSLELEENTRTVRVRAIVNNPEQILRAGMFGTARIHTGKVGKTPMVPVDAVQTVGEEKVVFVPGDEDGSFQPVQVTLGEESDGWVEIAAGLELGARVVIGGAFHLKSALTAVGRGAGHGH